jgi:Uma2 family endonuclease
MMGAEVAEGFMTLEEYIEFEKTSESKHEYRNGKLFEMAGGRHPHNLIAGEIFSLIKVMLKVVGKKCQAVNSDQKIYIPLANRGLFGDVMVYCGKPEFHDDNQFLQTNPLLVVEVLSKSTKLYDKGEKFDLYRSLPSFREYLLVSQEKPAVQARYLQDPENDLWKYSEAEGVDGSIMLQSIGVELKLKDIYAAIEEFTEEE